MGQQLKKRSEIEVKDTWNMEDMLPSDEAWEKLFQDTEVKISRYGEFRGRLADSADILYYCLQFDDSLSLDLERLFVYARQKSDEDTDNSLYQEMTSRIQSLLVRASEASAYLVPEVLRMDQDILLRYMASDNGIGHFKRAIDMVLAKKDHTLSAEMEELLAQSREATDGPSQIFNLFNNADVRFPSITGEDGEEVLVTLGRFLGLLESGDRRVRKDAFQALYSVYKQFSNTLAATFASNVKQAVFYGKARHYPSSRAYYLAENEVPEKVYDNLITTVRANLPAMHKYVALRKKALELDEIHMYDLYTPIVKGVEKKYTFDEAKEMVKDGLKPLGEKYQELLLQGFDNRWIDVYENQGKRSGAYSWGVYGTHPYVLLNYNGTLDQVFTLAHEMGHALHSYFSDETQPFTYAGYKIFVAEVASTCNEALLIRSLLEKTTDKKERAYLLNHFLESYKGTVFRQTMFAEFEARVHKMEQEGRPLTAKSLCALYHQLNVDYFGDEMVVDEEIDYEWSRIPHFYTPFYVYQYATGFSAAIAISNNIFSGNEETKKGYFEFLSGGCSKNPIELLRMSGVDMEKPEPIQDALKLFGDMVEEMEALLS